MDIKDQVLETVCNDLTALLQCGVDRAGTFEDDRADIWWDTIADKLSHFFVEFERQQYTLSTGDIVEIVGTSQRGRFLGYTTDNKAIVEVHNGDSRMGFEANVTRVVDSVTKSKYTTF